MKIVDITRELFGAPVYPGDPKPELEPVRRIGDGDICNLSVLHACLHNGTHLDAPRHFLADGDDAAQVPLDAVIGECSVVSWDGVLTGADAERLQPSLRERVLFKGQVEITESAAFVLSDCQVRLVGVEAQTVGNAAVQEAYAGAEYYGCDVPAVVCPTMFTASARELAESTGVELWDGERLSHMMRVSGRRPHHDPRRDDEL